MTWLEHEWANLSSNELNHTKRNSNELKISFILHLGPSCLGQSRRRWVVTLHDAIRITSCKLCMMLAKCFLKFFHELCMMLVKCFLKFFHELCMMLVKCFLNLFHKLCMMLSTSSLPSMYIVLANSTNLLSLNLTH